MHDHGDHMHDHDRVFLSSMRVSVSSSEVGRPQLVPHSTALTELIGIYPNAAGSGVGEAHLFAIDVLLNS